MYKKDVQLKSKIAYLPVFLFLVFLAVLESVMILVLSLLVTVSFFRVSRLGGVILLFHSVWVTSLMCLAFSPYFSEIDTINADSVE